MDFPSTIDFPLLHRFFDSSMKNKNRIQKTPNNYYYYLKKKTANKLCWVSSNHSKLITKSRSSISQREHAHQITGEKKMKPDHRG